VRLGITKLLVLAAICSAGSLAVAQTAPGQGTNPGSGSNPGTGSPTQPGQPVRTRTGSETCSVECADGSSCNVRRVFYQMKSESGDLVEVPFVHYSGTDEVFTRVDPLKSQFKASCSCNPNAVYGEQATCEKF
jgi:hypothetical protein